MEDDSLLRRQIAFILADEGYQVAQAAHGRAALALLDGGLAPDLILLDMRMPVMDGWAFGQAYQARPGRHAPIVVVTAAHDSEERAEAVGAAELLPKPFELDELIELVGRFVEGAPVR